MRTLALPCFPAAGALALAVLLPACGGSSDPGPNAAIGQFQALNANVSDGDVWEINRPILIEFNNPVDPSSISFASIVIRPVSPEVQGNPVTGSFDIVPGSNGKTVRFTPACPTNEDNDNGAFVPGGWDYELVLPTEGTFGSSILRDTSGTQLSVGLVREFQTPTPPAEQIFIDTVIGAPRLDLVTWPEGLNLFTDPDPVIELLFNQAIDSSPENLNTDRIQVLYSEGEIGTAGENTFLDSNLVPGELLLVSNCDASGRSVVDFLVTGILPPNRNLKVVIANNFTDLSGETNTFDQEEVNGLVDLDDYYGDPGVDPEDVTYDQISDEFTTSDRIDANADLWLPQAELNVNGGEIEAAFEFPGEHAPADQDFVLGSNLLVEISTDGDVLITDTDGRNHLVEDGVLVVNDLSIESGATLKGTGSNPFIIYASGEVNIQGTLDVSGDDALAPLALDSPHIAEPGALGQCGGGNGGTASSVLDAETLRGDPGDGPFGEAEAGGEGGEGAVNTIWAHASFGGADTVDVVIQHFLAGGGAGGNFAPGTNESVLFDEWAGADNPATFDGPGPDYDPDVHTNFGDFAEVESTFTSAGDGRRGSSYGVDRAEPPGTMSTVLYNGAFGMEDLQRDTKRDDEQDGWDPPWLAGENRPFRFGDQPDGPDQGFTNDSIFSNGDDSDNFWGQRFDADGTVTVGELATPWAGYGGGASGDASMVVRFDNDLDSFLDPIGDFFPDDNFPGGTTQLYLKGAPGGGGGGQCQIMAIGAIILGADARLKCDGGSGAPGESIWFSYNQVSGSVAGSGGHLILHSATGFDFSAIDIGSGGEVIPDDLDDQYVATAIGGRRGWAGSSLNDNEPDAPIGDYNGNGIYMVGSGGEGGNGIIQIHMPNPVTDIAWDPDVHDDIVAYIDPDGDELVDNDLLEEVLDVIAAPAPVSLIPIYSAQTMFQSTWLDTGLAELHQPANGTATYPDYADDTLRFLGISSAAGSEGEVEATAGFVDQGAELLRGSTGSVIFQANSLTVPAASTFIEAGVDFDPFFLNPELLVGYDVMPDDSDTVGFEVAAASYDSLTDTLTLDTKVSDGSMLFALNPANPSWTLEQRFFRIDTTEQKDRLPSTASVKFEFQGADASADPGEENEPGTPSAWTTDLADLEGLRFIRYRVTFDINADGSGVSLNSERPALKYVRIPFGW